MNTVTTFVNTFGRLKPIVIGMIHLRALPGSPKSRLSVSEVTQLACTDAALYSEAGVDALLVENMCDVPWLASSRLGPETVAAMSVVCAAVRAQHPSTPLGVQILAGANTHALAVAHATGMNFIRVEGFVFSHIGDEGPIHSCAAELLRYRRHLGAENVMIFTDIKKKHSSHSITADISLTQTAMAAELFLSDGVIITGSATGEQTDPAEVAGVQKTVGTPVLVGSGVTNLNLADYATADALIVGSHFKVAGHWSNDLDTGRLRQFMTAVHLVRRNAS